jgi:hypothetical protein
MTTSANNTTIPSASSITDSSGNVWTLTSGLIYENGVHDPGTYNVTLVLWYGNTLYAKNTSGIYYQRANGTWVQCPDPHLGGTSPDSTAIPPAAYIIDKRSVQWTLSNGYIYKNGVKDPGPSNVSLVLWYGGMIYHCGTGGQFYVWTWAAKWVACTDPRIVPVALPGAFYGMNGHFDYQFTPSVIITTLKALGCRAYRIDCNSTPAQLNPVIGMAKAFQSNGLTLLTMVDYGLYDANHILYSSETAAYNACFAGAAAIATALKPYGVTMYECGNELTRDPAVIQNYTFAGTNPADFINANWPILRGAMRGMIAGIKSVQANAKCGINFCAADVGASDMLWDGQQPDGSGGYPTVRWDITTWHNYQPYGDLFNIGTDGAGPGFNLPVYCKARYGVPFMITEWNAAPENTEIFRASYVTQQLGEFYAARKTAGIQSVMYYCLITGDLTYGIVNDTLAPIQPTYDAFKNFVAANPDT